MSWTPELYIGGMRPWPDAVRVVRSQTDESVTYVPERTCQIETTENWLPAERYHRCKECGAFFAVLDASHDIPPRLCPNCGRKVEK